MVNEMSKIRQKPEKETEWDFEPTLEIEPELNEDEILAFLAKLCQPVQEPSDPEKKETSA